MGTRNITAVFIDGEYKIAQYGQWDGYPEGQGRRALEFLNNTDLEQFKEKVKLCRFITDDELEAIDDDTWLQTHNQLSRDHGAKILNLVDAGVTDLRNQLAFVCDGLMCEWVYVIDFDKNAFEVFEGFNKTEIKEGEGRFYSGQFGEQEDGYHPVKRIKWYSLDNLPNEEQFLEEMEMVLSRD